MKTLRTVTKKLFIPLSFLLRPAPVQHFLRKIGVSLPYFLAKQLNYKGVVDFTLDGKSLYMQSHNTPIEMTIFWKGLFNGREGAELRVWHQLSQKFSYIYDVGANNGIYSLVASTNQTAKIFAFEPVPVVNEMLKENIALNKLTSITVQPEVVSDNNGRVTLFVPKTGWVDVASVNKDFATKHLRTEAMSEIECDSLTMDSHTETHLKDGEVVLMKIDVEGAEPKVLAGMKNLLSSNRVVGLIEILNQEAYDDFYNFMPSSYSIYGVIAVAPYLKSVNNFVPGIKNYIFVPQNQIEKLEIFTNAS
ncbi:FkbM family methyltransferase [Candidatus Kaiserbacteria bacterium]|nr:FkbM family methyltransferase [Candidatus Kaiserbacteria bacterium]